MHKALIQQSLGPVHKIVLAEKLAKWTENVDVYMENNPQESRVQVLRVFSIELEKAKRQIVDARAKGWVDVEFNATQLRAALSKAIDTVTKNVCLRVRGVLGDGCKTEDFTRYPFGEE